MKLIFGPLPAVGLTIVYDGFWEQNKEKNEFLVHHVYPLSNHTSTGLTYPCPTRVGHA